MDQVRDHKKRSVALGVSPSRLPSKERSVAKSVFYSIDSIENIINIFTFVFIIRTNPIRRKSLDDIV